MPIEQHFGESPPLSVGVEEEVMLLDGETMAPVPAVRQLLADVEGTELPGRLKTELHASIVELNTDICSSVEEAVEALAGLRATAADLLERRGLRLAAAGSHPFAEPEELEVVDEKRYQQFVGYAGITARRQGVSGLHVHIGMPGPDECMATLETILPWMPLVLALSVNSPYLAGKATGLASNRAEVLAQLPRSGAPPVFGSYAEWESWVERFIATGLAADYTQFWWDVRPHPRFGTLEIRMPDQPTALAITAAFIALLRDLCGWALEHPASEPAERGIYQQNRWAAARFGPEAKLIHDVRSVSVQELVGELPVNAAGLDSDAPEAARQLAAGDLRAVCADIVARTWPS
ncbi:MAG TPA: YbdK family carboxylate-amine ligase [Gaiellaceae bacterium]|jgi:carboxylate-amine ligase|nr:YbdK family carboxylate-amine ligase [Gaiellaceae bacterium]